MRPFNLGACEKEVQLRKKKASMFKPGCPLQNLLIFYGVVNHFFKGAWLSSGCYSRKNVSFCKNYN